MATATPTKSSNDSKNSAGGKAPRRRKRPMALSGRDRTVFFLMVAVPTTLHVLLVWVPTIASIFFSFTDWNGFSVQAA